MILQQLEAYMEAKAKQNTSINHDLAADKKAFYVVDDPYDLSEFEQALRNFASFPAMLLEFGEGVMDDNSSANYTDTVSLSFMIVDKRQDGESARSVRNRCLQIAKTILYQIRKDRKAGTIIENKFIDFRLNNISYVPVGPMALEYYGYMVSYEFVCPFTF